jgi:dCTP deaminase
MILTDRDIRRCLAEGSIVIEPAPASIGPTSCDLTLAGALREFADHPLNGEREIDPSAPGYSFAEAIGRISTPARIDPDTGYLLPRDRLILAWTRERVVLPPAARVAARVEGKSSLARLGLAVHVTAPTIHPGTNAQIQLEVVNHGPLPIRLRVGMPVCQLVFEQTTGVPEAGYGGQFRGQQSGG